MSAAPKTDALVDKHAEEYSSCNAILWHQYSDLADHARTLEINSNRYLWLRKNGCFIPGSVGIVRGGDYLDAAVDAAIAEDQSVRLGR